jgi:hypothetical protein
MRSVIGLLKKVRARFETAPVKAAIRYVARGSERPQLYTLEPQRTVMAAADHRMAIHDARAASPPPEFTREGFMLVRHASRVRNFADRAELEGVYREELRALVIRLTGSPRVFIHPNMILRSNSHARSDGDLLAEPPAPLVHCDFTARSVVDEARAAVNRDGIAQVPDGRLLALNIWRPLSPPPHDFPLALCDMRSIRNADLVLSNSYGNRGSATFDSELYLLRHHSSHRWSYYPWLMNDEVILFQQFDTAAAGPSAVPHVSFCDPRARATSPRLSLEARAFVFFH